MRLYMQIPAADGSAPRYYHLHLQEDLLEGWNLVREWGRQGTGGRVIKDHYPDHDQAMEALMRLRDEQLKRGYRVVFIQGQEQP